MVGDVVACCRSHIGHRGMELVRNYLELVGIDTKVVTNYFSHLIQTVPRRMKTHHMATWHVNGGSKQLSGTHHLLLSQQFQSHQHPWRCWQWSVTSPLCGEVRAVPEVVGSSSLGGLFFGVSPQLRQGRYSVTSI